MGHHKASKMNKSDRDRALGALSNEISALVLANPDDMANINTRSYLPLPLQKFRGYLHDRILRKLINQKLIAAKLDKEFVV